MALQLRNILSAIAAVGLLTFGQASDADASIFYNWSGKCSIGCSGQSSATLELRDSYEGGTNLRNRDFISFSYSSSGGTFDVPGDANLRRISGSLPSESSPAGANLFLRFAGFNFQITRENGLWATAFSRAGIYEAGYGSNWGNGNGDGGGGSVDVPAPASLLALLGALLALAFVWRRREPEAGVPAAA